MTSEPSEVTIVQPKGTCGCFLLVLVVSFGLALWLVQPLGSSPVAPVDEQR